MVSVITAERIADLIDQALGWGLVGFTVSQERLQADARWEAPLGPEHKMMLA